MEIISALKSPNTLKGLFVRCHCSRIFKVPIPDHLAHCPRCHATADSLPLMRAFIHKPTRHVSLHNGRPARSST